MASSTPNIVLLQVNGAERPVFEKIAASTITPGDLVEVDSTGKLAAIASAGKVNGRLIALENPFASDPTLAALAQNYSAGDTVRYIYAQRGDLVNARVAASQTVVIGSQLISTTTGGCLGITTVDATTLEGALVAIAEVAVTTTGSTGRVQARIV